MIDGIEAARLKHCLDKVGIEAARRTIEAAADLGIGYITLYGFSSENWKRPTSEVNYLMGLLRYYLRNETAQLHRNGVRVRIIGDREKLDPDLIALIDKVEHDTAGNTRLQLIVALSSVDQTGHARCRSREERHQSGVRGKTAQAVTRDRKISARP